MIWRSFLLSIVFLFSTSDAQDCSKAPTDDIKFICKQIEGWAANVSTIPANLLPGTRPLTANFIPTNPSSQNECFTIACLCRFFGGSGGEFCTVRGQSMRKGIRREYRVMSDNERQRYHAAMWAIKNNGAYDQLAQVHSQFQSSPGAHSGPAFLPWHREYIKRLEFALRRVDPSVTLPYWDSTLDGVIPNPSESSLFTPELMGQQSGDGSVRNGAFANWLILGNSRVFRREVGFRGGPFSERDINAVFAQNDVSRVLANTAPRAGCPNPASFDAFEYSHGSPHIWIGGDMLITTTATHDPIFWNHHAFVDMIWEQWRLSRQSRGARETAYPQSNSNCHSTSHYGNTIMTPFNPLVNTDGLSNMYTDFLYEYAPRPSCSANNINGCGSRFLFCDLSHGGARCSSKIRIGGNCFGYTRNEDRCYQGVCINNVCVAGQTTTTTTQGPTTFGPTTTSSTGQTCWNEHECCAAWAFRGECTRNPAYMLANCRAECPGGCTRTWNPNIDCEDRNSNCGTWSRQGQCTSNLNWMRENCRRSCNRCGTTREQVCGSSGQGGGETRTTSPMTTPMTPGTTPTTTQTTTQSTTPSTTTVRTTTSTPTSDCYNFHYCCEVWQAVNYCDVDRWSAYMSRNCRPSCNKCTGQPNWKGPACVDIHPSCSAWAYQGECVRNKAYMHENCKKSCNQCSLLSRITRFLVCGFSSVSHSQSDPISPSNSSLVPILPVYRNSLRITEGRFEGVDASPPGFPKVCDKVQWKDMVEKHKRGEKYFATVRRGFC